MTDWTNRAACAAHDPEMFFPDPSDTAGQKAAKAICAQCPVRVACLEEAMAVEGGRSVAERYGIRGGKTPSARRDEYRRRRKAGTAIATVKLPTAPRGARKPSTNRPAGWNRHKLTVEQRAAIGTALATGASHAALAKQYDVTTRSIRRIAAKALA